MEQLIGTLIELSFDETNTMNIDLQAIDREILVDAARHIYNDTPLEAVAFQINATLKCLSLDEIKEPPHCEKSKELELLILQITEAMKGTRINIKEPATKSQSSYEVNILNVVEKVLV